MHIPENISLNRVQTALFRSLDDTWPHLHQIQKSLCQYKEPYEKKETEDYLFD